MDDASTAPLLRLPTPLPGSLLSSNSNAYTLREQEPRNRFDTLSLHPGGVKFVVHPSKSGGAAGPRVATRARVAGRGLLRFTGLPVTALYQDGSAFPYYSVEAYEGSGAGGASTRAAAAAAGASGDAAGSATCDAVDVMYARLARMGEQLHAAGVREEGGQQGLTMLHEAEEEDRNPPAMLLSESGGGKTTLMNALSRRGAVPDAQLAAEHARSRGVTFELQPRDSAEEVAAAALRFAPLPPGYTLTLDSYEAWARAHPDYATEMDTILFDEQKRSEQDFISLHHRGPFVAMGEIGATSYVPMISRRSHDNRFHVAVPFRSHAQIKECLRAAGRAWHVVDEQVLQGDMELLNAEVGMDLLGYSGCTELPAALAGMEPSQWALPAWLRLFVGKKLVWSASAPTFEEGSRLMHDIQFTFVRGAWSPWAAIALRGYATAEPSDHLPLMDLQGTLDDKSSRNTAFLHVLNEVKPHAYVLLVNKEANKDVIDKLGSKHKISEALVEEHAKANTDAATHEHVPPRLIVVYVVDKNAGLGPFNPSKVNAAATERNKVEMRANFKRKLSGVLTSASDEMNVELIDASVNSYVHFLCVVSLHLPDVGMEALEGEIRSSYERMVQAQQRRIAHSQMRAAKQTLHLLEGLISAHVGAALTPEAVLADQQAVNDECEPLLRYCTDMGEWTTEDSFGEKVVDFKTVLEIETLTLIKDKYLDPIETELKGFISEAVRDATPSNFLRWFADARLETGAGASDADTRLQLAHLRNNSPDSKILGVALFPLLQALTNFSRITLAVFESRSTTGELTAHFTDKWLTPSFRNLLAGASTPATAKRWLFAQRLRAEVHDCFARFFATLNALGWQDLIRAAFRCGMADEHFPAAVRDAFAQGGRRHSVDGTVKRYAALTAALPNLLSRVSMRVEQELINCLWNAMVTVAEDVTKAVEKVCKASKLAQRPSDDAGAGAGPSDAAGAAEAGAAAGAMAQLAHAAAMSSAAEAVRRKPGGGEELRAAVQAKVAELLQLFNDANIPYDVTILGDAAANQPRAVRSLLSVATATAQRRSSARQAAMGEAAERARYADHLMSLNKPELLQHARHACVEVRNPTRVTKPALRALLLASKEQAEEHAAKRAKHDGAGPSGTQ